ncbi:MAG TPA: L,D-transpeptidase family protein [Acidiferrobacterales bacterium]|nr:L,D-transpeptidase family protein [Acidiferrobacterales bacterium]
MAIGLINNRLTAAVLAAALSISACAMDRAPSPAPALATETPGAVLRDRLREAVVDCGETRLDVRLLTPFYPVNGSTPRWLAENGPGARARQLVKTLAMAGQEGLTPARYRLADIEHFWNARTPAQQACLDLLLTDAFRRYSRDVQNGRIDPQVADPAWHLRPPELDPVAVLQAVTTDDEFANLLHALPPPHAGYAQLRRALARYAELERGGGWMALPPGPKLEPPLQHVQVPLLRARLRAEGDYIGTETGDVYDALLAAAVERFQRRHGIAADGIVGARTRAVLNVSAAERAAQIRRTLERWRWLPRTFGEHYVIVNTAGYELTVVERGQPVLGMRVIVGTPDQATPSFTAMLRFLVINPYWNIPTRIARDKLLPKQQRNPEYFVTRGIRVFNGWNAEARELDPASIHWSSLQGDGFPYRLRQEPGPKNSMGRLSFVFPNPFDVFLHDTPERWLFDRDQRAYSEGCVRIENAMALAVHTLRQSADWDAPRIQREIDALRQQSLRLPEPIPVYVLYLTSWADEDGQTHFREDIYARERVLAQYFPVPAE